MGRSPDFGVMNWLRARLADVLNEAVVNLQGDTLQTAIVYTWVCAMDRADEENSIKSLILVFFSLHCSQTKIETNRQSPSN